MLTAGRSRLPEVVGLGGQWFSLRRHAQYGKVPRSTKGLPGLATGSPSSRAVSTDALCSAYISNARWRRPIDGSDKPQKPRSSPPEYEGGAVSATIAAYQRLDPHAP
jgi:hypothetical protein